MYKTEKEKPINKNIKNTKTKKNKKQQQYLYRDCKQM